MYSVRTAERQHSLRFHNRGRLVEVHVATLWHVGDLLELICEFDDSPTHLTTLRRVSWSFHRAVENVWTLLLGRQNSVMGDEQLDSIAHRYRPYSPAAVRLSESSDLVQIVR
jgi:hypothetical protein